MRLTPLVSLFCYNLGPEELHLPLLVTFDPLALVLCVLYSLGVFWAASSKWFWSASSCCVVLSRTLASVAATTSKSPQLSDPTKGIKGTVLKPIRIKFYFAMSRQPHCIIKLQIGNRSWRILYWFGIAMTSSFKEHSLRRKSHRHWANLWFIQCTRIKCWLGDSWDAGLGRDGEKHKMEEYQNIYIVRDPRALV